LDLVGQERESEREELEKRKVAESKWADELHRLREEKKELNEHMAMLGGDSKAEVLINQIKAEKKRLQHDLEDQQRERQQVEDAAGVLRREMHGLRNELVETELRLSSLGEMEGKLEGAEERLARTQVELTKAFEERKSLADELNDLGTASRGSEETRKKLADEITDLRSASEEAEQVAEDAVRKAVAEVRKESEGALQKAVQEARKVAENTTRKAAEEARREAEAGRKASEKARREVEKSARKAAEELRKAARPGLGSSKRRRSAAAADDLRSEAATKLPKKRSSKPVRLEVAPEPVVKLPVEAKEGLFEDPRLGPLFNRPPREKDDLTRLSGVGEVIRDRLYEAGIYTFRQVAKWRAPQIKEVSEELKLRDRVKRDGWQKQARALHREKYGKAP
jgi:predicted flap endonuclease-1-like 5' DNA nuclease